MLKSVDTLVLAGGGVRGLAYGSCLAHLARLGLDFWSAERTIRTICGCSIGSLVSALIAVGVTPQELEEMARSQRMGDLVSVDLRGLLSQWGLDSGEKLKTWIDDILEAKVGRRGITLKECHALTGVRLEMVVTNLNLDRAEYVSHDNSPNLAVSEAVVMSMSLPPVFSPRKWRCTERVIEAVEVSARMDTIGALPAEGSPVQIEREEKIVGTAEHVDLIKRTFDVRVENEYLVIDGGIRCNYPMARFDPERTIGFRLLWRNAFALNSIDRYLTRASPPSRLALRRKRTGWRFPRTRAPARSIDVGDVSTLQFDMTEEELTRMLEIGREAAQLFARRHGLCANSPPYRANTRTIMTQTDTAEVA